MKTLQSKFNVISILEMKSVRGGEDYSQSFSNLDDNGVIKVRDSGLTQSGSVDAK